MCFSLAACVGTCAIKCVPARLLHSIVVVGLLAAAVLTSIAASGTGSSVPWTSIDVSTREGGVTYMAFGEFGTQRFDFDLTVSPSSANESLVLRGVRYSQCEADAEPGDDSNFCDDCSEVGDVAFSLILASALIFYAALGLELYHFFRGSVQACTLLFTAAASCCALASALAWVPCHIDIQRQARDSEQIPNLGFRDPQLAGGWFLALFSGVGGLVLSWFVCAGGTPSVLHCRDHSHDHDHDDGGAAHNRVERGGGAAATETVVVYAAGVAAPEPVMMQPTTPADDERGAAAAAVHL